MKKLFLVVAVAGLCTASGFVSASEKSLSAAWPSVSNSMTRLMKSTTIKAISASLATILPGLSDRRVDQPAFSLDAVLSGEYGGAAQGSACPVCPEPPCD